MVNFYLCNGNPCKILSLTVIFITTYCDQHLGSSRLLYPVLLHISTPVFRADLAFCNYKYSKCPVNGNLKVAIVVALFNVCEHSSTMKLLSISVKVPLGPALILADAAKCIRNIPLTFNSSVSAGFQQTRCL